MVEGRYLQIFTGGPWVQKAKGKRRSALVLVEVIKIPAGMIKNKGTVRVPFPGRRTKSDNCVARYFVQYVQIAGLAQVEEIICPAGQDKKGDRSGPLSGSWRGRQLCRIDCVQCTHRYNERHIVSQRQCTICTIVQHTTTVEQCPPALYFGVRHYLQYLQDINSV